MIRGSTTTRLTSIHTTRIAKIRGTSARTRATSNRHTTASRLTIRAKDCSIAPSVDLLGRRSTRINKLLGKDIGSINLWSVPLCSANFENLNEVDDDYYLLSLCTIGWNVVNLVVHWLELAHWLMWGIRDSVALQ